MILTINGKEQEIKEGLNLEEIMIHLKMQDKVMAAAINMEIVKKEQWNSLKPEHNDKLELLQFVGGG
ncbi:MAG: thiamine biosynthesis protein ThiS [Arcobacter sp.]|nr:sulfur carrier protein ThiS [Campylobacteraceae bacterium]PHR69848.1 MAG: thiamine biosynthesis protein ThiS [Arcobacter sp.]